LKALPGQGGMGEVYRAFDTRRQRTVALKRLRPGLAADAEYQERFRRESQLAARLSSPHVIPIHDFGEIDGRLFIDMRLAVGDDLGRQLDESGPLPPGRAVEIVRQIADVLDTRRTTLAYMAPELFTGDQVDRRVDVYALGCLFFEALTGQPPFTADGPALMYHHLNTEPPRPSAHRAELPTATSPAALKEQASTDPRHCRRGDRARRRRERHPLAHVCRHHRRRADLGWPEALRRRGRRWIRLDHQPASARGRWGRAAVPRSRGRGSCLP
jgi:serine/threonine protein kinase